MRTEIQTLEVPDASNTAGAPRIVNRHLHKTVQIVTSADWNGELEIHGSLDGVNYGVVVAAITTANATLLYLINHTLHSIRLQARVLTAGSATAKVGSFDARTDG